MARRPPRAPRMKRRRSQRRKATVPFRPWSKGFSGETWEVPDFSYTDDDWDGIAAALRIGGEVSAEKLTYVRSRITEVARFYLGRAAYEGDRRLPALVRREIEALDRSITALRERLESLSPQAYDRLDKLCTAIDQQPARPRLVVLANVIRAINSTIGAAASVPSKKGRPPTFSRPHFIWNLACIWKDCHGRWPTRAVNPDKPGKANPFREFVDACISPIDQKTVGLEDDIRRAIQMRKNRRC